jgi:hypothetical protein
MSQQLAESLDPLHHQGEVVGDVAQVALQLLVDLVLVEAALECRQHPHERLRRALELDDPPGELVDAP